MLILRNLELNQTLEASEAKQHVWEKGSHLLPSEVEAGSSNDFFSLTNLKSIRCTKISFKSILGEWPLWGWNEKDVVWGQKAASIFIWCPWKQVNQNLGECPFKDKARSIWCCGVGQKVSSFFLRAFTHPPLDGQWPPGQRTALDIFWNGDAPMAWALPHAFVGRLSEYFESCFDIGSIFLNI